MNPDGTPDINDITKFGETATGFIGAVKKLLPGISIASCHRGARRGTKLEMKDVETILSACKKNGLPQEYAEGFIREAMKRHRRSMNLAGVVASSEPDIDESASIDDVDDEWLEHFQDCAEKVSDESMQLIWGRILSGELNKPGTYSKRLLNILSQMGKTEADAFATLCDYAIVANFDNPAEAPLDLIPVLVSDKGGSSYNKGDILIQSLGILNSMGLIDTLLRGKRHFAPSQTASFRVGSEVAVMRNIGESDIDLLFEHAIFLPAGIELARVCRIGNGKNLKKILAEKTSKAGLELIWT